MADVSLLVSHRIRAARNRVVDVRRSAQKTSVFASCNVFVILLRIGEAIVTHQVHVISEMTIINIYRPVLLTIFQTGA